MKASVLKVVIMTLMIGFYAPAMFSQNDNFKALFIYNFTKYIEWPSNQSNEFVITVIGKGQIIDELKGITSKFKVKGKTIVIQQAESIESIQSPAIIFLIKDKSNELQQLTDIAKKNHILLIAEKPNSCGQGAAINFVSKGGNLGFEINRANIERAGLEVNSALLALGTVVQ